MDFDQSEENTTIHQRQFLSKFFVCSLGCSSLWRKQILFTNVDQFELNIKMSVLFEGFSRYPHTDTHQVYLI